MTFAESHLTVKYTPTPQFTFQVASKLCINFYSYILQIYTEQLLFKKTLEFKFFVCLFKLHKYICVFLLSILSMYSLTNFTLNSCKDCFKHLEQGVGGDMSCQANVLKFSENCPLSFCTLPYLQLLHKLRHTHLCCSSYQTFKLSLQCVINLSMLASHCLVRFKCLHTI